MITTAEKIRALTFISTYPHYKWVPVSERAALMFDLLASGMTHKQVAEALGVSRQAVTHQVSYHLGPRDRALQRRIARLVRFADRYPNWDKNLEDAPDDVRMGLIHLAEGGDPRTGPADPARLAEHLDRASAVRV